MFGKSIKTELEETTIRSPKNHIEAKHLESEKLKTSVIYYFYYILTFFRLTRNRFVFHYNRQNAQFGVPDGNRFEVSSG